MTLSGRQFDTPKSFLLKDAKMLGERLFILSRNNRVYCFKESNLAIPEKNEIANIRGVFKDSTQVYIWTDHEVYLYQTGNNWKLQKRFKDRNVKGLIALEGDVKVVFFDGLLSLKTQVFIKSPNPIKEIIKGAYTYILCSNKFLYKLGSDEAFIKVAKLDSLGFMTDMLAVNKQVYYLINHKIKFLDAENKTEEELKIQDSVRGILGYFNNCLIYQGANGIIAFNLLSNEASLLIGSGVSFACLLQNGNLVYNDSHGRCNFFQLENKKTVRVGEFIKSYQIVDFLKVGGSNITLTSEGIIFKQTNQGETVLLDIFSTSGKVYGAVLFKSDLYIACENGLLSLNVIAEKYNLSSELRGIECNSIVSLDKFIYVSSLEKGVFKIKPGKSIELEPKITPVNEGLLVSSTYLIRNYNDFLFTVSNSGVYQKNNGNDRWEEYTGSGFIEHVTGIAHFRKHCNAMLISSIERGVMKTNDEGKTYSSLNLGLLDSAIIDLEVDSNGFFALAKGGDVYFHPHEGVEWSKINRGHHSFQTAFLHQGSLCLVNQENNIDLLETEEFKPGLHINWEVKNSYCHGDKISLSFLFTGLIGANNHAVLQLKLVNGDFDSKSVLMHSDLREGSMEFTLSDSLEAGTYQIRLVGTDPFIRPEKALATFTLKPGTPKIFPQVTKGENGTLLEAVKLEQIKCQWLFNGLPLNEESRSLLVKNPGTYGVRYTNITTGCMFTTKNYYLN